MKNHIKNFFFFLTINNSITFESRITEKFFDPSHMRSTYVPVTHVPNLSNILNSTVTIFDIIIAQLI